jgi:hypothetical protein
VIIVDDRLALEALAGTLGERLPVEVSASAVATTWGFHYRLVRAYERPGRAGALRTGISSIATHRIANPRPDRLVVLDPREITATAATFAQRHRLNVLAAELVGAGSHHEATVVVSERNVGRTWHEVFAAERVALRIV